MFRYIDPLTGQTFLMFDGTHLMGLALFVTAVAFLTGWLFGASSEKRKARAWFAAREQWQAQNLQPHLDYLEQRIRNMP